MADHLSLQDLIPDWIHCTRCPLAKTRKKVVFGTGNPHADVLLVGEAPGEDEDRMGEPFVGQSGQTLNSLLDVVRLDRDMDLFITNVCACRPFTTTIVDGNAKTENRTPTTLERTACWPRLEEVIYRVDPLIIVTMGKTPTTQVLGRKALTMENVRGQVQTMVYAGHHMMIRYPVLPMYHPAYLLRNQNQEEGGPWQKTTLDFLLLTKILDNLRAKYYGATPPDREAHLVEDTKTRGNRR